MTLTQDFKTQYTPLRGRLRVIRYPSTDFRFAPVATVRRRDGEAEGPRLGEECAIGDHRVEGAAQRREPLRPFANVARVT